MVPHQILHARQILRGPGQALVNEQAPERWRLMRFMRHLRIRPAWITWWKRAWRLIRCTIVPLIHRQARINHANPRFATSRSAAGAHVASTRQPGRTEVVKIEDKGKGFRRLRVRIADKVLAARRACLRRGAARCSRALPAAPP